MALIRKKASEVFDLLEKFANYGFNKSHAAAYAVVSYQTAWLKANHPVEFMAGVMNCDIHLTDKLATYFQEVKKGWGSQYTPPCVNRSQATFDVKDQKLVYALGALKNVGVEAMKLIVDGALKSNLSRFLTLRGALISNVLGSGPWRCSPVLVPLMCSIPTAAVF